MNWGENAENIPLILVGKKWNQKGTNGTGGEHDLVTCRTENTVDYVKGQCTVLLGQAFIYNREHTVFELGKVYKDSKCKEQCIGAISTC